MAMLGSNTGLLGKRRTVTPTGASGIWTRNEHSQFAREALWPVTGIRYWRFANWANTFLHSDTLDLTEIEFYLNNVKLIGITAASSFGWNMGSASILVDGVVSTGSGARAYKDNWDNSRSTATLSFDFGTTVQIDALEVFSLFTQPRFPASFDLQFSLDGSTYYTSKTVTVGTSFTSLGNSIYTSGRVAL